MASASASASASRRLGVYRVVRWVPAVQRYHGFVFTMDQRCVMFDGGVVTRPCQEGGGRSVWLEENPVAEAVYESGPETVMDWLIPATGTVDFLPYKREDLEAIISLLQQQPNFRIDVHDVALSMVLGAYEKDLVGPDDCALIQEEARRMSGALFSSSEMGHVSWFDGAGLYKIEEYVGSFSEDLKGFAVGLDQMCLAYKDADRRVHVVTQPATLGGKFTWSGAFFPVKRATKVRSDDDGHVSIDFFVPSGTSPHQRFLGYRARRMQVFAEKWLQGKTGLRLDDESGLIEAVLKHVIRVCRRCPEALIGPAECAQIRNEVEAVCGLAVLRVTTYSYVLDA